LAQGKYQEALEDLNSAIDAGRNDCLAFLFRAQIKAELGDSVGAEQDRLAALERDAVDAQGWVHRSRARLPDDPLGALADLDRGMQYTNELGDLLRNRAHVLADHLSRYDDAIQTLNQLQQYEGPSTFVFYSRGSLYAKLGNRQATRAEAEQLLRTDDSAESRFLVALIFARLKDREPQDVDAILRLLTEAFHRDLRYVAIAADDPELAWLRNHPQGERWFHAIEPLLEIPTPE
jgi:tetratricopeptide (TPR) repeat protein